MVVKGKKRIIKSKPTKKAVKLKSVPKKSAVKRKSVKKTRSVLKIKKLKVKKIEISHIASRSRKIPIKIVKLSPRPQIKSSISFFSFAQVKSLALIFVLFLGALGLHGIGLTNSFYYDIENSSENAFKAGAIDFILYPTDFNPYPASLNFESGTTTSKIIDMALEPGSNPIKYQASTTDVSGDIPFCDAIVLGASLDGQNQFTGSLTNFSSPATTTIFSWKYDFSLPTDAHFYNSVCSFAFGYNGRQTLPHNEYDDGGYYDLESATSTIHSWGFRINKVYYDVDTTKRGNDPENEWVEIYNQTDQTLDIVGWQICDDNECDVLASSSPILIPAKKFAVITASSTTWNYWQTTDEVVPVLLSDSRIGDGLSNDGDRLVLKRPDGVIIDEMNWQTNSSIWDPGASDVENGHILARKPDGYDTNQPSDFVDFGPPILNLIYPNQSGTLVWYWNSTYKILWDAINPNGPKEDLKIDLSYIKDTDGNALKTFADEIISIGKGLANTGFYKWKVPSGFTGYIWIKIVAFGPENPMLNTQMASGKIYDPIPLFVSDDSVIGIDTESLYLPEEPSTGDESSGGEILGAETEVVEKEIETEIESETEEQKIEEEVISDTMIPAEIFPKIESPETASTTIPSVTEEKAGEEEEVSSEETALVEEEVVEELEVEIKGESVEEPTTETEPVPVEPVLVPEPEPALVPEPVIEPVVVTEETI